MAYGFRMFGLKLTPHRKLSPELKFDHSSFGKEGAFGVFAAAVAAAKGAGSSDDKKSSAVFRIKDASKSGWVIVVSGSGGGYGRERDVFDVQTNSDASKITSTQAVMEDWKFLLVIPSFGDRGLLVSMVSGRSHGTPGLMRAINSVLRAKNLTARLESDIADEVAWRDYFDQADVDVQALELVQKVRSSDRTSFGTNASVKKATLRLQLADSIKGTVFKRVTKAKTKGKKVKLAGVLGLQGVAEDADFDEQMVVYVQNKRERKISVTQGWPAFTYDLGLKVEPSWIEFLDGSYEESAHLLEEMGVDVPPDWWPVVDNLETL